MERDQNRERPNTRSSANSAAGWRQALFLGGAAFGASLLYLYLNTGPGLRLPSDQPEGAVSPQAGEAVKAPAGAANLVQEGPGPEAAEETRGPLLTALLARRASPGNAPGESGTQEAGTRIERLLQELASQGPAAVPAIHDLLQRMHDGDDVLPGGGTPAEQQALRLALFDALHRIGGSEAAGMLREQLLQTIDPREIVVLAGYLEDGAPGAYREDIITVARASLQANTKLPRGERHNMVPLFEYFESFGGPEVVALLDHNAKLWWEYSSLALTILPEGEGIPSLVARATDPNIPVERRPRLTFRLLAQASAQYPEAGATLVAQARAGQIPDRAWPGLAAALEGVHLQLPSDQGEDKLAQPVLEDRYEESQVLSSWSVEQVQNQIALIDELLNLTAYPVARDALYRAREQLVSGS